MFVILNLTILVVHPYNKIISCWRKGRHNFVIETPKKTAIEKNFISKTQHQLRSFSISKHIGTLFLPKVRSWLMSAVFTRTQDCWAWYALFLICLLASFPFIPVLCTTCQLLGGVYPPISQCACQNQGENRKSSKNTVRTFQYYHQVKKGS